MWKSWRRQRKTKKIILKEFFSIGQCFVLTKDYGEHYLGNFGLSKSCSHHLKIYIYIYIHGSQNWFQNDSRSKLEILPSVLRFA